jgi:hypothetical protein
LGYVFTFQVWVVPKDCFDAVAGGDLAYNRADSDSHAADAGFSAHYAGSLGDAVKSFHRA